MRSRVMGLVLPLLIVAAPVVAQAPDSAALRIGGEVPRPMTITAADFAKLPHVRVSASEHDKPAVAYEGVALLDVLKLAGVEVGPALRGPQLATAVLLEAADGYRVVLSLAELDPGFRDKQVLLVDRADGKPLTAEVGPYRLVIPEEKRPARWIRQVRSISLVTIKAPGA